MIGSVENILFILIQRIPLLTDGSPILTESAVSLASKIRNQEQGFSSVAAVRAYSERIKQVNGIINAVVDTRL